MVAVAADVSDIPGEVVRESMLDAQGTVVHLTLVTEIGVDRLNVAGCWLQSGSTCDRIDGRHAIAALQQGRCSGIENRHVDVPWKLRRCQIDGARLNVTWARERAAIRVKESKPCGDAFKVRACRAGDTGQARKGRVDHVETRPDHRPPGARDVVCQANTG